MTWRKNEWVTGFGCQGGEKEWRLWVMECWNAGVLEKTILTHYSITPTLHQITSSQDSQGFNPLNRLAAVVDAEFQVDVFQVAFDGFGADKELIGNFLIL